MPYPRASSRYLQHLYLPWLYSGGPRREGLVLPVHVASRLLAVFMNMDKTGQEWAVPPGPQPGRDYRTGEPPPCTQGAVCPHVDGGKTEFILPMITGKVVPSAPRKPIPKG